MIFLGCEGLGFHLCFRFHFFFSARVLTSFLFPEPASVCFAPSKARARHLISPTFLLHVHIWKQPIGFRLFLPSCPDLMHVEKEAIYTIRKRALRIQARLYFLALGQSGLSLPLLMLMWDQLLPNSLLTPEQLHLSMNSLLLHLVAYHRQLWKLLATFFPFFSCPRWVLHPKDWEKALPEIHVKPVLEKQPTHAKSPFPHAHAMKTSHQVKPLALVRNRDSYGFKL